MDLQLNPVAHRLLLFIHEGSMLNQITTKIFVLIAFIISVNPLCHAGSRGEEKMMNCLVYAEFQGQPRSQIGREKMTAPQCIQLVDELIRLRCLSAPGQAFILSYVIDDPNSLNDIVGTPSHGRCADNPQP